MTINAIDDDLARELFRTIPGSSVAQCRELLKAVDGDIARAREVVRYCVNFGIQDLETWIASICMVRAGK